MNKVRNAVFSGSMLVVLVAALLGTANAQAQESRLVNISTRGYVGNGDFDVLIGGFIISGTEPLQVLLRARGPSLTGVEGQLADPTMELRRIEGTLIGFNDDWRTGGQEQDIINSGLAPTFEEESAMVVTLEPGGYTPIIRGYDGATGIGIVEIFEYSPAGGAGPFTVSGMISIPQHVGIDSDVNDPAAPYAPNDTAGEAQPIPAPATVGGYLNFPGAGADGRSKVSGDMSDFYATSLTAGTTVTLTLSDESANNDLDLWLYDANDPNEPVDWSETPGTSVEAVTAPYTGEFLIEVFVWEQQSNTATNYVMNIGQGGAESAARGTLNLRHDFVPGEVIVRFKDEPQPDGREISLAERAASVGMRAKAGAPGREMLLALDGEPRGGAARRSGGPAGTPTLESRRLRIQDPVIRAKHDTMMAIKELRMRSDVLHADPNYIVHPLATPDDQYYSLQWHYSLLKLPQAWDTTTGSSDVVVAVIDTGVLRDHWDLEGRLLVGPGSGYDFISNPQFSNDGDGIDPDWDDPGDLDWNGQSSFHGTHVAGTIGAATNNGVGVSGVDWNCKIMPVRVLGVGGGTDYDAMQGVRYAAGLPNDSGTVPQQQADVMNLSFGGPGFSGAEQDVVTLAREAGTIIIGGAGNGNTSQFFYPASYEGVVSVAAVDLQSNRAPYSNYGAAIDVAAPGGDTSVDSNGDGYIDGVLSTVGNDSSGEINFTLDIWQGTSMASPHMAGVVALMKAVSPNMTPADLDAFLVSGEITGDLGDPGRDDLYGWGLIDALAAVSAAGGTVPTDPVLIVTPSSLNFGLSTTSATLSAGNAGGGTLTVSAPTDDASWLTVTAAGVDGNGLGTYTAEVDRSGLPDGAHAATITFNSNANTIEIPVVMQVGTGAGGGGNAGYQYVFLIDFDTAEVVDMVEMVPSDGVYSFSFTDVPEGHYLIGAGTDSDHDLDLCDTGEACGAFPLLNDPAVIAVGSNLTNLNFSTEFNVDVGGVLAPMSSADAVPGRVVKLSPKE